jgi:hypothetical protein
LLVEAGAAAFVLGMVLVLAVQMMGWVAAARADAERRRFALSEAQNALERLVSLPVAELTPERITALKLDEHVRDELPGGRLEVRAEPRDGPPTSVRLRVEVRWRDRGGGLTSPVRLTTWCFTAEEPSP